MARVFFQKHSSTSVSNDGRYSVGENVVEQIKQNSKTNCFVDISRVRSRRKALPMRHSRKPTVSIISWLFTFQSCARHMHHFAGCLLASYPWKHSSCQFFLSLHTHTHTLSLSLSLSHITLTNKSHMKYRIQKIEHNYNQIWYRTKANKTYSCKLQLYRKHYKGWHKLVIP